VAPVAAVDAQRLRLTGRLIRTADLPVLNRPMAPGDEIGPQDIETLRLRTERIGPDVVVDLRELVGKTPRRPLRAHEPLRVGDIQIPVIVHRGDLVTIVLETATMRLTAQGKALDDGGQNANVRIANTKSSRVVDAIVVGPNTVTVGTPAQLATR
jgi:flagellar basal body P-ring formation protein FlgA